MKTQVSNMGACVDVVLRSGASFSTTLAFTDSAGDPIDLTGVSLAAQLRKRPLDAEIAASFTISVADPSTGIATMAMSAATSGDIPCGNAPTDEASIYAWDLEYTDANGAVSSPLFGTGVIFRSVTR